MRYGKISWAAVFVLAVVIFPSCAPKVKTLALMPAEVNLSEYQTISVLDFEAEVGDWGKKIASWLEEELSKVRVEGKPYFTVVSRSKLEQMLREQDLEISDLTAPETSRQVGRLLGLDGLITGSIKAAHTQDQIYTTWRLYVTRTAHLDFTVQVISTETGSSEFSETFTGKKVAEAFDAEELTELTYHDEPLTSLVKEAIGKFIRKIAPHYATLELTLRSKDDSPAGRSKEVTELLQRGNKYGEKGDWNSALELFRQAVNLQQGSPAANYNLAVVLERNGELHKAKEHYEAAARLKREDDYLNAVAHIRERLACQEQVEQQLH